MYPNPVATLNQFYTVAKNSSYDFKIDSVAGVVAAGGAFIDAAACW
jgi:hypothetical protein